MASRLHTSETSDFDFVFVTDTVPLRSNTRPQCNERTAAKPNLSSFDAASLNAFHEEFKRLVLEDDESAQVDLSAETFIELFDSRELEEVEEEVAPQRASSHAITAASVKPAPRQIVRPMSGPPIGTLMPIETWVVKVIVVLVSVNLLFAGLIISGVRIKDLFN